MDGLLSLKTRLRRLLAPGQAAPTTVLAMPAAVARPEPEPEPGPFQGYLDAASNRHVAGWIRDLSKPGTRVAYRVIAVIDGVETVLHEGVADEHTAQLETIGVGDGSHAFYARFDRRLSDTERDSLAVQVVATGRAIELAPGIEREWNPIRYIALDVVDNCNLRCPFCLFDYTGVNRTNAMDPAAFASTLRLAPLTTLGNFWLSCLHEPTLHPQFEALLDGIPQEQRRKVFYTTNLAKRMPQSYYELLAGSGLHNLNISIESFDPAIYERMRKGAKHRIFSANWDIMLDAFARGSAPPKVRYIMMAYRSNLAELPTLVRRLREEKQAWQVEVRFTYPEPHIPAAFCEAEFLEDADWAWLREQFAGYDPNEVILIAPPAEAAGAGVPDPAGVAPVDAEPVVVVSEPQAKPRSVEMRITWDGKVRVTPATDPSQDHDTKIERACLAELHISEIGDPDAFLAGLVA